METNCFLELPIEVGNEILSGVTLKPSIQSTETPDGDVSRMLLDNPVENHGGSSFSTSGIDFEFVNSELGSESAYALDHSSVFDIAESVIDEKSELFRDSEVFDDVLIKHNDIDKQRNLNLDLQTGTKLIMDLGLKLQIIPLNNLKFVSTIETSEGVHIVALPDTSSTNQSADPNQPLIRDIFPQLSSNLGDDGGNMPRSEELLDLSVPHIKKADVFKVLQIKSLGPQQVSQQHIASSKPESWNSKANSAHTFGGFQKEKSSQFVTNVRNSDCNGQIINTQTCAQMMNLQKRELSQTLKGIRLETKGDRPERSVKESKILIDLRKLIPQRKPRKMVSLLNSPKTSKVYSSTQLKIVSKHMTNAINSKTVTASFGDTSTCPNAKSKDVDISCDLSKNIGRVNETKKKDLNKVSKKKNSLHVIEKRKGSHKKSFGDKKSKPLIKRNDRGYQCRYCQTNFKRLGNYKNHITLHNSVENREMDTINVEQHNDDDDLEPIRESEVEYSQVACIGLETMNHVKRESFDGFALDNSMLNLPDLNVVELSGVKNNSQSVKGTMVNKVKNHDEISERMTENGNILNNATGIKDAEQSVEDVAKKGGDENAIEKVDAESGYGKKSGLVCNICHLCFSSEGNLTRHKLIHMRSGGRYACSICKKCFHQQCDLKRHETVHTGQLPFNCDICHKGFLRKSDLASHENFHTKKKTYKCSQCSKSYFQSGDLQRHIRQSHSDSCSFSCQFCPKKYTAERSLFTHVRSKHKQQSV